MELTKDQHLALQDLRKNLYERLACFSFTEEMLKDFSAYHLVCILTLVSGHRNYVPQFSHTVWALGQIFGDAFWDTPTATKLEAEPEQKPVVN